MNDLLRAGFLRWHGFGVALLMCGAGGCAKEKSAAEPPPKAKPGPSEHQHAHGAVVPVGELQVGGFTVGLARQGAFHPGHDTGVIGTVTASPGGKDWRGVAFYAWVVDAAGKRLAPAQRMRVEDGKLHAHVPVDPAKPGASKPGKASVADKLVLRVRDGKLDQRASLSLGDLPAPTPHGGLLARLKGPDAPAGWVEVKLHDDKGDIELWLYADEAGTAPLDRPLDAAISVRFPEARRQDRDPGPPGPQDEPG